MDAVTLEFRKQFLVANLVKGFTKVHDYNRPVSLTSIVYKVLEKLEVKHLELNTSAETTKAALSIMDSHQAKV